MLQLHSVNCIPAQLVINICHRRLRIYTKNVLLQILWNTTTQEEPKILYFIRVSVNMLAATSYIQGCFQFRMKLDWCSVRSKI